MRNAHSVCSVLFAGLLLLSPTGCDNALGIPEMQTSTQSPKQTPEPPQLPCSEHKDATSCAAQSGCVAHACPTTCEGDPRPKFDGCYPAGEAPACPGLPCAPSCADRASDFDCESALGCVSVFVDHGNCDCIGPGCCQVYDHCVDQPLQCVSTEGPPCLPRFGGCASGFAPIYQGSCAVGCVRIAHCAAAGE